MRAARWLPVAVVVLLLAGCGQATHVRVRGSTLRLTESDNSGSFAVKRDQTIVLTLPSNPSTGYRWHWTYEASAGGAGLRQLSHRYVAPKTNAPGASGEEVWRLRPVGSKGSMIQGLYYGRLLRTPRPRHWSIVRRFDVDFDLS
jgi:inhibitor of cysteine peptidase